MATVGISRRTLIAGTAAAALAAALPASPAAEAAAPPSPAAPVRPDGSWGFSLNGEEWHTGYDSMDDALGEAHSMLYDEDCTFEVGYCVPDPFHYPDVSELLADWLADGGSHLGVHLKDWFNDSNADHDWDGGLGDEIDRAPAGALEEAARIALDAALVRAGVPWPSGAPNGEEHFAIGTEDDIAPSVLERIATDTVLGGQVIEAYKAWVAANGIENAPRTLSTRDVHSVAATYDEENDGFTLGEPVPEGRAFAPAP